jgi:hypothetical protein
VFLPHDHPSVHIDPVGQDRILCPYRTTLYRFDSRMASFEVYSPDRLFIAPDWYLPVGGLDEMRDAFRDTSAKKTVDKAKLP